MISRFDSMDENEWLLFLMKCYDDELPLCGSVDQSIIQRLAKHESSEIRDWVAKALVNDIGDDSVIELLCSLAQDIDFCVRLDAIDTLCTFATQQSFCALVAALSDSDELVQKYAAIGVALVGRKISHKEALNRLTAMLQNTNEDHVLVGIYEGLYILGQTEMLYSLFRLYETSEDYHVQCSVLHTLDEILNPFNVSIIQHFADGLDCGDCPLAVADAVKQVRQHCKEEMDNL